MTRNLHHCCHFEMCCPDASVFQEYAILAFHPISPTPVVTKKDVCRKMKENRIE